MAVKSESPKSETQIVGERELTTIRIFNAPREFVFKAWTDPKHVAKWWGPNGFTTTIEKMDVRPGGEWLLVMHGPDGTDYPNRLSFKEVKAPELLTYAHGAADDAGPDDFQVRVLFEALGPKSTKLTMRMLLASVEALEAVKKFGAVELGHQTLAKLGERLKTM